ncbi:pilus assembly protein TadG-related protein [Cellulosimicrobium sp. Marseille-Q8652]
MRGRAQWRQMPAALPRRALRATVPGAGRSAGVVAGDRESGQVTLLTSAFVAFALLLVTVVVSATQVHLERKRLFDLADALALTAADSMTHETFYLGDAVRPEEGAVLTLSDADIRSDVQEYLERHPDAVAGLHDVRVVASSTPDGRTAEVSLVAVARPAMVSWVTQLWSDGIIVRAESRARAW